MKKTAKGGTVHRLGKKKRGNTLLAGAGGGLPYERKRLWKGRPATKEEDKGKRKSLAIGDAEFPTTGGNKMGK